MIALLLLPAAQAGYTSSFELAPTVSTHRWQLADGTTVRHPYNFVNVGEVTAIVDGFTVEAETSGLWQLVRVLMTGSGPDGTSRGDPAFHGMYATLMSISIGNCPWYLGNVGVGWRATPLHVAAWGLYQGADNFDDFSAWHGGLGLPIGVQAVTEPIEEELFLRASVQYVPWFNMQEPDGVYVGWSIKTDLDLVWEFSRVLYLVGNVQSEVFPVMGNDLESRSTDQPSKGRHTQFGVGVSIPLEWVGG